MKLYLIRHGQTDWNVAGKIQGSTDIPLNDMGKKQAACLAEGMKTRPVTKVFCSHLSRAYETARAIGDSQHVEVKKIEGLEEVGYGVWEGMTMDEIAKEYPEELKQWYYSPIDVAPPQGESQAQVYDRCSKALKAILDETGDGDAAIVSHGATTVFLLEILLRDDSRDEEDDIIVGNASISTVEYERETGKFVLAELNDREHLRGLEEE